MVLKLKERCVWLHEFENLDEAREVISVHTDGYTGPLGPVHAVEQQLAHSLEDVTSQLQLDQPPAAAAS